MEYVGLQTQIWRNNFKSLLLLAAFPLLLFGLTYLFFYVINYNSEDYYNSNSAPDGFISVAPIILVAVAIWFLIAWFSHSSIIQKSTGAKPLERNGNQRIYNLVENLCISQGMKMPKVFIINDDSLNAYASGLNESSYSISLSKGIIDKLEDDELEGVIAHELTHIKNRDVRLLIISIIFVGIFSFISEVSFRMLRHGKVGGKGKKGSAAAILLIIILGLLGYLLSLLFKLSLSRKREFMADAGAIEMTKKPKALANALRKISVDPWIEAVEREDVAQLFIDHPTKRKKEGIGTFFRSLFATHPPIEERIEILEQF